MTSKLRNTHGQHREREGEVGFLESLVFSCYLVGTVSQDRHDKYANFVSSSALPLMVLAASHGVVQAACVRRTEVQPMLTNWANIVMVRSVEHYSNVTTTSFLSLEKHVFEGRVWLGIVAVENVPVSVVIMVS